MTLSALRLHDDDTVACLLRDHAEGQVPVLASGSGPALGAAVAFGHKVALVTHATGDPVIKYGQVIGHATRPIAPGDHVHLHNLAGAMA